MPKHYGVVMIALLVVSVAALVVVEIIYTPLLISLERCHAR